jgi:hypothetical protein
VLPSLLSCVKVDPNELLSDHQLIVSSVLIHHVKIAAIFTYQNIKAINTFVLQEALPRLQLFSQQTLLICPGSFSVLQLEYLIVHSINRLVDRQVGRQLVSQRGGRPEA